MMWAHCIFTLFNIQEKKKIRLDKSVRERSNSTIRYKLNFFSKASNNGWFQGMTSCFSVCYFLSMEKA